MRGSTAHGVGRPTSLTNRKERILSATSELVFASSAGSLERIENDGRPARVVVSVNTPAPMSAVFELVREARVRGYAGHINLEDQCADGSESWVVYAETDGKVPVMWPLEYFTCGTELLPA